MADFPTPAGPARINNLGEEYPPGSGARPVALLSHARTRSTVFGYTRKSLAVRGAKRSWSGAASRPGHAMSRVAFWRFLGGIFSQRCQSRDVISLSLSQFGTDAKRGAQRLKALSSSVSARRAENPQRSRTPVYTNDACAQRAA